MTSPVLNVARYSALLGGISYGILHRRTLQAKADKQAEEHEWKRKVELISKAKEAYKEKLVREKAGGDGVVSDPEDPNFDLEKFLAKFDK